MKTINISLPDNLKARAQQFVELGEYASFSDLVRDALREKLSTLRLGYLERKLKKDIAVGKAIILKSDEDIVKFFDDLV